MPLRSILLFAILYKEQGGEWLVQDVKSGDRKDGVSTQLLNLS